MAILSYNNLEANALLDNNRLSREVSRKHSTSFNCSLHFAPLGLRHGTWHAIWAKIPSSHADHQVLWAQLPAPNRMWSQAMEWRHRWEPIPPTQVPQGTPRTGLQTFPQQSRIGAPLLVANSQFHPLDHATRPKPAGASQWLGILGPVCTLCLLKAASSNTSTIHFFHHICSSIFLPVVWCLYKPLILAPFLSEVFVYVSF